MRDFFSEGSFASNARSIGKTSLRSKLLQILARLAPRTALRYLNLSPNTLGRVGERLAARYLRRSGWKILADRLLTEAAEIDLLAMDGDHLVCVEVKTGRVPFCSRALGGHEPVLRWRPGRHATPSQLKRLRRAAQSLAPSRSRKVRVDLVEVLVDSTGRRVEFIHHRECRHPPKAPPVSLCQGFFR